MTDDRASIESIRAMMRAAAHPLDVMDPLDAIAALGLTVHSIAGIVPPNWAASVMASHGYAFEPEPEI